MKVLICTPYYLPNVSGITSYIKVLSEELAKDGFDIEILTSRHDPKTPSSEVVNGVKISRIWSPIKIGKGLISPIFPIISIRKIMAADVVNCHLPQLESGWLSFWGRLLGKKVILSHHTDLSFWSGLINKLIDSVVHINHLLAAFFADRIISYTKDYADHSYFLRNFPKKTINIYPPIIFNSETQDRELKKTIEEKTTQKKYVLGFCGRVAKQKGIEVLVDACKYLDKELGINNYLILLAGPTKVIGENLVESLKSKYGKRLDSNFVFLGNIERASLATFYKSLDILVLPSNDALESFGWVQVEAMRCGVPCVATDMPGMRVPVLSTGFGELFEKNNAKALAEKIVKVLRRNKKHDKELLKKVKREFDPVLTINKYKEILRRHEI
jgi:glycosyltransferase involved in cell wall biosynthesis